MNFSALAVILTLISSLCYTSLAALSDAVSYYETLHPLSFRHHIKKRDLSDNFPEERDLEFDTLGRHFNLVLQRSTTVISSDFKVVAVGANNEQQEVNINPTVYHGYLADEPDSFVSAYFEDDSTLVATIKTKNETYAVEPSWRHLDKSPNYTMISYKGSDLRMDQDLGKRFCGFVRANNSNTSSTPAESLSSSNYDFGGNNGRSKRATCTTNSQPVCTLLLVADYKFFKNVGQSNMQTTATYLIGQIDKINALYMGTSFGSCGSGFGFEIKQITIHQSYSASGSYNDDRATWDTNALLTAFSQDSPKTFRNFCLAHLFTYTSFSNGVLGLAYIGGAQMYSVGGICSSPYSSGGTLLQINTGWSSALSVNSRALLTLEAMLVTAHEFGHNWGSEHDPDSNECAPSSSNNGKFIMYMYSVSGLDANNKAFSPCSTRTIGSVLFNKAAGCFKQRSGAFCGNSKREDGEQCDAGVSGDKCCSSDCKLLYPAVCSDLNHQCCVGCKYAAASTVCSRDNSGCQTDGLCSGSSTTCSSPVPKADSSLCGVGGSGSRCRQGVCTSLCEYNNKFSCVCDKPVDGARDNTCSWCCRDSNDANSSLCQPYGSQLLPDGIPCYQGYCQSGQCVKVTTNNVKRVWKIIDDFTVSQLVMFMRANIVGTVIVLSLIIWIPICSIISFADYKKKKMQKTEVKLQHSDSFNHTAKDVKVKSTSVLRSRDGKRIDDKRSLLMHENYDF